MRLLATVAACFTPLLLAACSQGSNPPASTPKSQASTTQSEKATLAAPVGSWLAGDTHVHNDHSADGSAIRQGTDGMGPGNVSVADQIGQGVMNGLSWLPLTDHRTYDQHYDPLWESSSLLLIPGEECNGSPHCKALGALDWLVQDTTYAGRPGYSRIQGSIWDAHLQGAIYGHNHPDDGIVNSDGTFNENANAVGFDVVETWNKGSGIATELKFSEALWNKGFRFAGVGGGDNHFRELWQTAGVGLPATQVFALNRSERAILQGLQGNRANITNRFDGVTPTATLEADLQNDGIYEAIGGDEVVVPKGTPGKLRVTVTMATGTTINVWKNPGKFAAGAVPFKTATGTTPTTTLVYDITTDDTDAWYYVEVVGVGETDSVDTSVRSNPTGVTQQIVTNLPTQRRAITTPLFIGPRLAEAKPAVALPADVGGSDGAVLAIGEVGSYAGFPDVAVTADGVHHLVAERHEPGATKVVYRRLLADGSLASEIDLAPASKAARFPKVVARGQNVFVVWQDERAGQVPRRPAIYLRRSADGGATWAAEQVVRTLAGRAEHPAIALTPANQPVVAWQEIRAAEPFDVFAQVIGVDAAPVNVSRPGKTFNAANAADTRSALYPASLWPAVSVRADGLIAIAYQDNRTDLDPGWTGQVLVGDGTEVDHWKVRVQVRKPAQTTYGTAVLLGKDGWANRHPSLAFAADGALVAVWDALVANPAGESRSVRYALSANDGGTFANATDPAGLAIDPKKADSQQPRLGVDADGRVRAVWFDNRAADWRWRTMTAVLGTDRNWSAGEMLMAKGLSGWPATSGGAIVMASTRNALRLQRDVTQQVFVVPVGKSTSTPTVPATPIAVIAPASPAAPGTAASNTGRFGGGALGLLALLVLAGGGTLRRPRR